MPKLVLVAKRVKSWIEPLLYRNLSVVCDGFARRSGDDVIRISTSNCLKVFESKPASFIRDHVRHLALTQVPDKATAFILSRCTGALGLGIFQAAPNPSLLPAIAAMGLLQISVDIDRLFGDSGVDFRHFAFAQLTHLDLINVPAPENWTTGICALPCLTHLSFNFDPDHKTNLGATASRHILAECKSLEVLILIFSDAVDRKENDGYQYFSDDPRSVTMVVDTFLEDWEKGATGRDDYWARAETFIQKRRAGEINGPEYSIPVGWET
ncbi:hypothetical protein MSAN_01066300 [Mycena sanguinolenta]|uniref:Uncharacterized protein n=1 Tax=Mycena sanguinolenta TaxID=230812 RepID=A0A8H7D7C1_9AGAR|nr:hypothetical protein MSAN_01066300 [Mycena sanguinolenta]